MGGVFCRCMTTPAAAAVDIKTVSAAAAAAIVWPPFKSIRSTGSGFGTARTFRALALGNGCGHQCTEVSVSITTTATITAAIVAGAAASAAANAASVITNSGSVISSSTIRSRITRSSSGGRKCEALHGGSGDSGIEVGHEVQISGNEHARAVDLRRK